QTCALPIYYKKKLGLNVVNMNWAQLEHNFIITMGKFAYYTPTEGVHYRDNAIFGYSEVIKVNEGETWRVLTRVEDSISWTLDARGLLLDENNNFVDFIPVDSGKTNSGVSTVIIPKGVNDIIINVLKHTNNQTQTHILKLHDFKNIWDKNIYGYEKDKFISNTGTLTTPSTAKLAVTGAIPVSAGEIYRIAN